jgi:purine-nucleoside phosphorylase
LKNEAGELTAILEVLRPIFPQPPQIAVTLGSGLGDFADTLQEVQKVFTSELPGYPQSTVPGHRGCVISGKLHGKPLICFQGRIHLYEGYTVEQITLPVRVARSLGADLLILTNASGGISDHLDAGSLMLITDQIDLQFRRRTRPNDFSMPMTIERERWFSTRSPYDEPLQQIAVEAALKQRIPLARGTLGALLGPSYETPAEVRMERLLGADAACMSTVAEAAEGSRLGMNVLGISCITNKASGLPGSSLDHQEVIETAARVKGQFIALLDEIIRSV